MNINKELPLGDIEIILPTELTFDMKVKEEREAGEIWKGTLSLRFIIDDKTIRI